MYFVFFTYHKSQFLECFTYVHYFSTDSLVGSYICWISFQCLLQFSAQSSTQQISSKFCTPCFMQGSTWQCLFNDAAYLPWHSIVIGHCGFRCAWPCHESPLPHPGDAASMDQDCLGIKNYLLQNEVLFDIVNVKYKS